MDPRLWLERLAPRERLLVVIAGALIVVAVVVVAGVRPLMASRAAAAQTLEDRRAVLNDIDRIAARLGPQASADAGGAAAADESMVLLVDRTARSHGLSPFLKRNEPDGTANIRLRFENAPFDNLMAWLAELHTTHGVSVVTATADPSQEEGRVSSNLQLTRAAR